MRRKQGVKAKQGTMRTGVVGSPSKIIDSEFYKGKPRRYNKKALALIENISSRMTKTASGCGAGGAGGSMGSTMMSSPNFYHPEYEPSSLLLPRDPIEVNAWCRYFYKYDALVSTAIDCHAELPISTIRLTTPKCKSKDKARRIREKYEEMCSTENLDLFNKLLQIGVEYYKLGNVFPFAQWSEKKNMWGKLTILDPDYVEIDKLQFTDKTRIDLRPNDRLKEIISNGPSHDKTGLLYKTIPDDVRELIATGKKIPLNTNPNNGSHVSHISLKMSDYDTLGTSLIERNFKALVYKDRLRQSQDAIAARHLTPKHLIWADNLGNMDVEAVREQIDNAFADPDYAIITNYELHWELIGTNQGLMSLDSEWNWLNEELMIGLMINKSFLLGEGSYANGQTVLEVLNQRYSIYRERLESYIIHSLFLPMAIKNDFCEYEKGTVNKGKVKKYIYPRIKWNRLNFVDDTAHKQMLSQMVNQGQIDMQTWLEQFGLDAETIEERLKRFEGTPLDVNFFEEQRSIASEVGRALAPAIAKLRADQRGIEIPKEEGDEGGLRFGDGKRYKMIKTSSGNDIMCQLTDSGKIKRKQGIDKKAESREERESIRNVNRSKHRNDKIVKDLEPEIKEKKKPPREDMKSTKLFEGSLNPYESIPLSDTDKIEEVKQEETKKETSKEKWIKTMTDLGLNQNSRRAALVLENDLLSANGKSSKRIKIINQLLPQVIASKIKTDEDITTKVEKVKRRYSDKLMDASFKLDSSLDKNDDLNKSKNIIRKTIMEITK